MQLKDDKCGIKLVKFNSDDSLIATGNLEETIKIWDVCLGKCIKTLSNKPYPNMNITDAIGLTLEQRNSLKSLGAVEE